MAISTSTSRILKTAAALGLLLALAFVLLRRGRNVTPTEGPTKVPERDEVREKRARKAGHSATEPTVESTERSAYAPPRRFAGEKRSARELHESRPGPLGPAELRALHPLLAARIQDGFVEENRHIFNPCFDRLAARLRENGKLAEGEVRSVDFDLGLEIVTEEEVGRIASSEFLTLPEDLEDVQMKCFAETLREMTFDAAGIDFIGRIRFPVRAVVRGDPAE